MEHLENTDVAMRKIAVSAPARIIDRPYKKKSGRRGKFSSRGIENEFLLASSRHPKKNVPGTKIPVFVPRVRKREFSYLV